MKKIIYLFSLMFLVFASCEPLEDVYEELDAQGGNEVPPIIGTDDYTLVDEDYTDILGLSFTNFSSNEDAKTMVSDVLLERYPQLSEGSSINVTYNLFNPIEKTVYTVTDEDYTAVGLDKLVSEDDFNTFLNFKFTDVKKGDIVDLTYKTLAPTINYTLTNDDFASVGNGTFNNFDIRPGRAEETLEARRAKIETILLANFPDTAEGQQYEVEYAIFDGSSGVRTMLVQLNATGGYDRINGYTLTDADYDLVGNGRFDNFDIRPGRDEETIEARRAKIETILLNNFPTAATGDQYFVTYAVWEGFDSTRTMLLEFNGTGYDIVSETLIEKTSRFTYVTDWNAPTTLTSDDYRTLGQSFDNFDIRGGDEEALRLLAIYLKSKFPLAAEGDFAAVQYNTFDGSSGVANKNFTFDGLKWNAIPTVITQTLQFGFNGSVWEPDNTIRYTLTAADYALVGNDRFNNFDVREGRDEETIEARVAKINTILLNNFPELGEGQKFVVIYDVWRGFDDVFETKVIKNATEYVLNE